MRVRGKPRPAGRQAESRHLRLLVLALSTLVAISLLSRLPAWSLLELRSFDYLSTVDDPRPPPGGPVIVAIDEPSLADINAQWPWPRSLHACLIVQLLRRHPAAQPLVLGAGCGESHGCADASRYRKR